MSVPSWLAGLLAISTPQLLQDGRPVRVGPCIEIGAVQPIKVGLNVSLSDTLGALASIGYFKLDLANSRSAQFFGAEASGRWFPWAGHAFLAVGLAYQSIVIQSGLPALGSTETPPTGIAQLTTFALLPRIGGRVVWGNGMFLEADIGYSLPILYGGSVVMAPGTSDPNGYYTNMASSTRAAATHLAGLKLPVLTLARVGWQW